MTNEPDVDRAIAVVTAATRRSLYLIDAENRPFRGRTSAKAMEVTVGDHVTYVLKGEDAFVLEVLPRRNCFSRSYREETRTIAANLDRVFIVTGVKPLFH